MTDVDIKTGDLAEMDVLSFSGAGTVPSTAELVEAEAMAKKVAESIPSGDMSTDLLQIYLRDVAKYKLLTAEQEVALAKIRDGLIEQEDRLPCCRLCRTPIDALVNHNLRMVITVANRYHRGRGAQSVGYLDLIQEGTLGLLRAAEKYDYTKLSVRDQPYRFSTYAMWWIRQGVSGGLAKTGRTIKVPVHVIEKLGKLVTAEKQLHAELGREPSVNELSERVDMKPAVVSEILRTTAVPISLSRKDSNNRSGESDVAEFGSILEDATTPSPHAVVSERIDAEALMHVLSHLPPRTLDIIQKRFGLNGEEEKSLTDIGATWGLTYQRVRQIELEVLTKLKAHPDLQTLREDA